MKQVEQLLRERIGLDAASVGASLIERTVRLRMKALGLHRAEDYQSLLLTSAAEWTELVESVVVGETWFFRDREPFAALAKLVLTEWFPAHPTAPLRLLSVPCSSGEEPYSMAMALLEAGLPPERFRIDGVDISAHALACARRAVYGRNSFRGEDLAFRTRYFQPVKDGFALLPTIRETVHLHPGNVVSEDFLDAQSPYDFIFCRNLLIYFDSPTQHKALRTLDRLLTDKGFLFVGPAELPLVVHNGFASANIPMAFVCRKTRAAPAAAPPKRRLAAPRTAPSPPPQIAPRASLPPRVNAKANPPPAADADLESARRLADAGRLDEAAALCEDYLHRRGVSAQAYYLLGLIHDAGGDTRAAQYYRKALYLEPNHPQALQQMAWLCTKAGDPARARVFRNRAQRVQGSGSQEIRTPVPQAVLSSKSKSTMAK